MMKRELVLFLKAVFILAVGACLLSCAAKGPAVEKKGGVVIGEIEPVTLVNAGVTMLARIDTGATTSSLDARDISLFERDGKRWVRFVMKDRKTGEETELESRLSRTVEIVRHGVENQDRPVVKLKALLGHVELVREFSLTDRSKFTYPILIGRNVLEGEFLVDVNLRHVTSPMSEKKP